MAPRNRPAVSESRASLIRPQALRPLAAWKSDNGQGSPASPTQGRPRADPAAPRAGCPRPRATLVDARPPSTSLARETVEGLRPRGDPANRSGQGFGPQSGSSIPSRFGAVQMTVGSEPSG